MIDWQWRSFAGGIGASGMGASAAMSDTATGFQRRERISDERLVPLFIAETLIVSDGRGPCRHFLAERLDLGLGLDNTNGPGRALAHAGVAHRAPLLPGRAGDHPVFGPRSRRRHEFQDLERAKINALAAAGAAACIYSEFQASITSRGS